MWLISLSKDFSNVIAAITVSLFISWAKIRKVFGTYRILLGFLILFFNALSTLLMLGAGPKLHAGAKSGVEVSSSWGQVRS